jgi:hypothetical protein
MEVAFLVVRDSPQLCVDQGKHPPVRNKASPFESRREKEEWGVSALTILNPAAFDPGPEKIQLGLVH